ncbi:MAG: hypothetical protein AB1299_09355, partial [Thermoproteota archaeon]
MRNSQIIPLFVDGIRSKLCELVDVKRVFCLFRGLLTLLEWCQDFVTEDAKFRILELYEVLWGRYCFSYANR